MVPEKDQSETNDETSTESHNLSETSHTSIQEPELAEKHQDQHLLLWGRFWGLSEDLAVAFLVDLNLDEYDFTDEMYHLYEDPDQLKPFDPDQHFFQFKRIFEENPANRNFPNATRQKVQSNFRKYLNSSENEQDLVNYCKTKNREQFSKHAYNIVSQILSKGEVIYHFNAKLSTFDSDGEETANQAQEASESNEESEETSSKNKSNHIRVIPVTSPMNGVFPDDINVDDTVFIRVIGQVAEQLPEKLQSSEQEECSVPLEATVRSISSDPDLPTNFDGHKKDYWELTVTVLEENTGQCFLHKNTQIKSPKTEGSQKKSFLSPFVLLTTGIILLALMALAYYIFGI